MIPKILRAFISGLVLAGLLAWSAPADAASYIKFDGIDGESKDKDHDKWINILSYSGDELIADPTGSGGLVPSSLGDVVVVRELDKSSTKLQEACANGTVFPRVEVHVHGKSDREPYYRWVLTDVIVSSYGARTREDCHGDSVPMEEVSLNYTEVEWTYVGD